MKNLIKNFAFSIFLFIAGTSVYANDILKEDAMNQMENYLSANNKNIVHAKSWNKFKEIVKIFIEDKAAFQSLNENQITVFNNSVSELNKKMSKFRDGDAGRWINNLNETAEIMNRRWNFDFKSILPNDEEVSAIPSWFNLQCVLPVENENYDQLQSEIANIPAWFKLESLLPKDINVEDHLLEPSVVPAWFDISSLLPKNENTEERIIE